MDRKQMIAQKAQDLLENRIDELQSRLQQDRQELYGWQEPAQMRAVLRHAVREDEEGITLMEIETARSAGEPERGQQRQAIGRMLDSASSALHKISQGDTSHLSSEEALALEFSLLIYARPGIILTPDHSISMAPFWTQLENERNDIDIVQRAVGRIELLGHPEYDWAGTAFLVGDTALMTTRRTAEIFCEPRPDGTWKLRPGISAWMNFRSNSHNSGSASHRIDGVLGIHENYDLAVLRVESASGMPSGPAPLSLASQGPDSLVGRSVYLVGYPIRDSRRNEPEMISRIFRDIYSVKRIFPGKIRGVLRFGDIPLLQHDCGMLGQLAGACLLDMETHEVLGMQLSGRYLELGSAVPLSHLRNHSLLQTAGANFSEAREEEVTGITRQVERLARSRVWQEAQATISRLYEKAFGGKIPD